MKIRNNLIIVLMVAVAIFLSNYYNNNQNKTVAENLSDSTRVHFLDVGQGDCIFIESNGEGMLIDAGESGNDEKIINYLNELNISQIKYVIATHPHSDHIGSMDDVLNEYNIDNLIMPNVVSNTKQFEDMLSVIESKNINTIESKVGDSYNFGECSFTIISPYEYDENELNNCSVGIKLIHGNDSFIFMGDTEKAVEKQILSKAVDISADLYKASHHGSNTSSSEEFLNAINPEYVVISCGKDNKYGHPHKEILERYKNIGAKVYRTDESGDIVITSTGNGLKVEKGFISGTTIG